jgi:hypothetical protein
MNEIPAGRLRHRVPVVEPGRVDRSGEDFAPRRLAALWPPLARGEYPGLPNDCGV